jgi:hypothetical protein
MAPLVMGTLELHLLVVWWRMLPAIFLTGVVFMSGGGVFAGGALSVSVILGGGNERRCLLPGSGGHRLQAIVPSSCVAIDVPCSLNASAAEASLAPRADDHHGGGVAGIARVRRPVQRPLPGCSRYRSGKTFIGVRVDLQQLLLLVLRFNVDRRGVIFESGEAHSTSTTQDTKSSKTQAVEGSVDGENVINSHTQNTINSLRIKGRIT